MIPENGQKFHGCYLLTERNSEFGFQCFQSLMESEMQIVGISGINANEIRTRGEKHYGLRKLRKIFFDQSERPWFNDKFLNITLETGILGINGGIEFMLPQGFLDKRVILNLHPAPLPLNRGSHHSFWSIIEGHPMGATIHWMTEELDAGPIVDTVSMPIPDWMIAADVQVISESEAINLLKKNTGKLFWGNWSSYPQEGRTTKHFKKEILAASTIEGDKVYTGEFLLRLSRAVCNKKNGFYIKTSESIFKVTIQSVTNELEN